MTAVPAVSDDPHTPLVEALAMADGLSALAANASERDCQLKGFELMMLLAPIRERIHASMLALENPPQPAPTSV